MLRLVLVGGPSVDTMADSFKGTSYELVNKFQFTEDLQESIIRNYGEYLDVTTFAIFQYGISTSSDFLEQINVTQELIESLDTKAKLYFILKDDDKYELCEKTENVIRYEHSHIIKVPNIAKDLFEKIITGSKDTTGLYKTKVKSHKVYEEDLDNSIEDLFAPTTEVDTVDLELTDLDPFEVTADDDVSVNDFIEDDSDEDFDPRKKLKKDKQGKVPKIPFGMPKAKKPKIVDDVSDDPEREFKEDLSFDDDNKGLIDVMRGKEKKPKTKVSRKSQEHFDPSFEGIIAVTGNRGAGSSSIAANLADMYSRLGKATMIVDMDYAHRTQNFLYSDFDSESVTRPKTQLGLLYGLKSPEDIDDFSVVVVHNLVLLGMGISEEAFPKKVFDKSPKEMFTGRNILELLGTAKSEYDVVIVDIPLEYILTFPEISVIFDKVLLISDNTIPSLFNLFSVDLEELASKNVSQYKALLKRSYLILNRYNENAKRGNKTLTPDYVESMLSTQLPVDMKVACAIEFDPAFYSQVSSSKRAIYLSDYVSSCIEEIITTID